MKKTDPAGVGVVLRDVMARLSAGELEPIIHSRWPLAEAGGRPGLHALCPARRKDRPHSSPSHDGQAAGRPRLPRHRRDWAASDAPWPNGLPTRGPASSCSTGVEIPTRRRGRPLMPCAVAEVRIEVELADVTDTAAIDAMMERIDANLPPLGGVIHSVGSALGRRADQPDLGQLRAGAVAEDRGSLAPAPRHDRPRSRPLYPVLKPRRRHGQSGPGEPRRGQCLPRPARRSSSRSRPPRTGNRLGSVVGDRRSRRTAGANRAAKGRPRRTLVLPRSRASRPLKSSFATTPPRPS